jgi:hypothetical protein
MATGDTVLSIPPQDFFAEGGLPSAGGDNYSMPLVGLGRGISFPAQADTGVIAVKRLPATASLATGLTFKLLLAVDPHNPTDGEVSKATVFEVSAGMAGATTAYYPVDTTGLGTASTGTATLASTAGKTIEKSIAVTTANLGGGLVANTWAIIRVRRLGTNSSDTSRARVVLLGVTVLDT